MKYFRPMGMLRVEKELTLAADYNLISVCPQSGQTLMSNQTTDRILYRIV